MARRPTSSRAPTRSSLFRPAAVVSQACHSRFRPAGQRRHQARFTLTNGDPDSGTRKKPISLLASDSPTRRPRISRSRRLWRSTTAHSRTAAAIPNLGYNYPFQFDFQFPAPNDWITGPVCRRGHRAHWKMGCWHIPMDPSSVNGAGLNLRGIEFDYKTPTPRAPTSPFNTSSCRTTPSRVGYVGTYARHIETFTGSNQPFVDVCLQAQTPASTSAGPISGADSPTPGPPGPATTTRSKASTLGGSARAWTCSSPTPTPKP